MFSKPIFKQCIRSHGKTWGVFTLIMCVVLIVSISSYDAGAFGQIASAVEGTQFESMAEGMNSFLGSLENYYKMVAVLLAMVYVILTANGLVAEEVDKGSMAYTLSTPVKRSTVVITKMSYMIGSVILMFLIIMGVGIGASEISLHCISDTTITEDVKAAADVLNRKESYVRDHLYIIKDDTYALKEGAIARDMDAESYSIYLDKVMLRQSYKSAAKKLTEEREDLYKDDDDMEKDDIEITWEELESDPSLLLDSEDALKEGAPYMDMTVSEYKAHINNLIVAQNEETEATETPSEEAEAAETPSEETEAAETPNEETETAETLNEGVGNTIDMTDVFDTAMNATAKALEIDISMVSENMLYMKEDAALEASAEATGLDKEMLTDIINEAIASSAYAADDNIDFDMEKYVWLNIGCCLLILAFSGIGFFASCLFSLTKNAMTLGGGLPFGFFIISVMTQMSDNLDNLKYLTITSLFNTEEIMKLGDFGIGLWVLAGIIVVLYTAGCVIFTKKDLPL